MALPNPWRPVSPPISYETGQAWVDKVIRRDQPGYFALKRLKNIARRGRFAREVEAASRLSEAGLPVVNIVEAGLGHERPYFVMPWIDGGTLEDRAFAEPSFAVAAALELLIEAADALSAVHTAGYAHRDVKPSNVLLAARPILSDFGLCLQVDDDADRLTGTEEAVGSRLYIAPENESGINESFDQRPADCYAFGKMIYAVLIGRPPPAREALLDPGRLLHEVTRNGDLEGLEPLLEQLLILKPRARLVDWRLIRRELEATLHKVRGYESSSVVRHDTSALLDIARRIRNLPQPRAIQRESGTQNRRELLLGEIDQQISLALSTMEERLREVDMALADAMRVGRGTGGRTLQELVADSLKVAEFLSRITDPIRMDRYSNAMLVAHSTVPGWDPSPFYYATYDIIDEAQEVWLLSSPLLLRPPEGLVVPDFLENIIYFEGPLRPRLQQTTDAINAVVTKCVDTYLALLEAYLSAIALGRDLLQADTWGNVGPLIPERGTTEGEGQSS